MDFPPDIWCILKETMLPREWANVCYTSPTTFALRTPHVVAMVRTEKGDSRKISMEQLQLDRWPSCHSLCVNLSQLGSASLTFFQKMEINQASRSLPVLHAVHIIGRCSEHIIDHEDLFMGFLAKHASVLTLQARAIEPCLDLPALRHLVLDLGPTYQAYTINQRRQYLDVTRLKALKTLYLRAPKRSYRSAGLLVAGVGDHGARVFDLTGSPHLEHVAVQGVCFEGKLALPAGCQLHASSETYHVDEAGPEYAHLVTALTLHHTHKEEFYRSREACASLIWGHEFLERRDFYMRSLKRLQLIVADNTAFDEGYNLFPSSKEGELWLRFCPYRMPSLEVLEMDVQCNLGVFIHPACTLRSLILVAAGTLQVRELSDKDGYNIFIRRPLCQEVAPIATVGQMYLRSGAAFVPEYRKALEVADSVKLGAGVRLLEHIREEGNSWTARMPASFQPGDLQECCCGACPGCLARAGVPILFDQAWTRDGFDKHMRPRCSAAAPSLSHAIHKLSIRANSASEDKHDALRAPHFAAPSAGSRPKLPLLGWGQPQHAEWPEFAAPTVPGYKSDEWLPAPAKGLSARC